MFLPAHGLNAAPMSNFLSSSYLTQEIVNDSIRGSSTKQARSAPSKSVSTAFASSGELADSASMPRKLAARYPEATRSAAERAFKEVLRGYREIESRFGIPKNDVAGATAAFIAGNYMAYRDVDFPDEHFKPLVAQMRRIIGTNASFAKASNVEKREMYEQMAIVGTYMAVSRDALKKDPDPKIRVQVQQAAELHLRQFLNTDADRVLITANGLTLR